MHHLIDSKKQKVDELLNTILSELKDATQSEEFKETIKKHTRRSENGSKTIQKFLNTVRNENENLVIVYINLIIDGDQKLGGLEHANGVFRKFKRSLRRSKNLYMTGFFWKLERRFDGLFSYHCFFLFTPNESYDANELVQKITQIWCRQSFHISHNSGCSKSNGLTNFKDIVVDSINKNDDSTYEQLFNYIRYLCKKDQFIMHKSIIGKKTFDTGRLGSSKNFLGRPKSA